MLALRAWRGAAIKPQGALGSGRPRPTAAVHRVNTDTDGRVRMPLCRANLNGYYSSARGPGYMKRRDFILAVTGAAVLSRTARGQQASPVVGVLGIGSPEAVRTNFAPAKARLAEMGFIEGKNIAIEYRAADYQQDRLPEMAGDLVQRRVATIVAFSGPAVSAAKAATTSIPIIFFTGFDPLASGFAKSLNRPGGNVTGVSILTPELNFKRLELLHELVPVAKTIAFLYTRTGITSEDTFNKSVQRAAEVLGVKMLLFDVSSPSDLDESFARAQGAGADALVVNSDAVFQNNRQKVIALAASTDYQRCIPSPNSSPMVVW
jgi:putative ABC transport system substrate-binding protein